MELDSVERALLAERKQGYLNTGAWEGFHNYIMGIFSRCGPALTPEQSARLRETASRYGEASPWDRRALWSAISETWKEALPAVKIWNEKQADAPSPPATEQPAAERSVSQTTEPPARPSGKKGTAGAGALSLQYVKG
ncbi:MAG: hypothetical protein LBL37_05735, partial [Gracilibacteraceae bacterium]|nr:hypothetical protein [Gracilibacteraceae bacterium]